MSAVLLFVATFLVQLVLASVAAAVLLLVVWVLWDCLAGPSAGLAAENRRRARREVHGR
jgi:hypothetical protein